MIRKNPREEELPNFQFPLFTDSYEIADYKLAQKLPLEMFLKHEGLEVIIRSKKHILSINNSAEHPKDSLKLEIHKWLGGRHFHGNIFLPHISFIDPRTSDHVAGYGVPYILSKVVLHQEKEKGFNTDIGIYSHAKIIAEKYFPGFKLILPEEY